MNYRYYSGLLNGLLEDFSPEQRIDKEKFLSEQFFQKQRDYIECKDKYVVFTGSKRSGKSSANAGKIVYFDQFVMPEKPGFILFCTTFVEHAKRLAVPKLIPANNYYNLKWKFQLNKNSIITKNNVILFGGLKDAQSIKALQGLPYKCVIIDEANIVPDHSLKDFVVNVVSLGMIDFEGMGQCNFTGNPLVVNRGYLYKNHIKNPETKKFKITVFENKFLYSNHKNPSKKIREYIDLELKHRGETFKNMSNNSKRMILGEDAPEENLNILNFKKTDIFSKNPDELNTEYILGCDFGYKDRTAVLVIAYDKVKDEMYVMKEWQSSGRTISEVAKKQKSFIQQYPTYGRNIVDTQGSGLHIAETIHKEHGVPFEAAQKSEKLNFIYRLIDYNRRGKIKIRERSYFQKEQDLIFWNAKCSDIDETYYHSDIFYALFYAFRFIQKQWIVKRKESKKKTRLEYLIDKHNKRYLDSFKVEDEIF